MSNAKHIGIVAVSAEGAALCYQTICSASSEYMGPHNHPEVSLHTFPLSDHVKLLDGNDLKGLARLMDNSAEKLISIGAEIIICPDNTNHLAFDYLKTTQQIPWLHIAREVASQAHTAGFTKLGLLGTRYLTESQVYPHALQEYGITYTTGTEQDREMVHNIIFNELVYGIITHESLQKLTSIITDFQSQGCEAVILGCTEIPLIVNDENSPLPTLDSTRILARSALKTAITIGH